MIRVKTFDSDWHCYSVHCFEDEKSWKEVKKSLNPNAYKISYLGVEVVVDFAKLNLKQSQQHAELGKMMMKKTKVKKMMMSEWQYLDVEDVVEVSHMSETLSAELVVDEDYYGDLTYSYYQ